jgi:hypothetical protein
LLLPGDDGKDQRVDSNKGNGNGIFGEHGMQSKKKNGVAGDSVSPRRREAAETAKNFEAYSTLARESEAEALALATGLATFSWTLS